MQKGENVISIALAVVVVLTILAIQRKWQPASLQEVASSAEEFILTGIRGQVPDIAGYERVKTFRLDRNYRAGLYRQSPAPLIFAPGRFVIYNRDNQPVFKLETLEGSKDSWTTLYDFAGRNGLPVPGSGRRPVYTRNLTGTGRLDMVIGQYSGGDRCCTTATAVELGDDSVKPLGRIEGLAGLPFEGLELRKLDKDPAWEILAHRPQNTLCGFHADAADILSIYGYVNGQYTDQTGHYALYLASVLKQNLGKWSHEKGRTLGLLQTLVSEYAALGQREQAKRLFAMSLTQFLPNLKAKGVDPNACLEDVENLLDRLPSVAP
jgi:hypothetical protein